MAGSITAADALAAAEAIVDAPGKAALLRVFMAGEAAPRTAVEAAIGADAVELCMQLGLLADADGERLAAPRRVVPIDGLLIASDHSPRSGVTRDFVIGLHPASLFVARNTPRGHVGRMLDLGCGAGVQALLAARHAEHVVATDLNARALDLSRLNAELNGLELDLREGSWFEPVADERFDLIAANPPFVISPDDDYTFRDAGLEGDAAARITVEGAARRLTPGGYATILTEWAGPPDVPRGWLEGSGVSLLTLLVDSNSPAEHAVRWNNAGARTDPERFSATVERWTRAAAELGIDTITLGVLIMRADGRGADLGTHEYVPGLLSPAGDHIEAIFDNAVLEPGDDHVFEPLPGMRVNQTIRRGEDRWTAGEATVRVEPGLRARIPLTREELRALFAFDGTRPLAELGHPRNIVQRLLDNGLIRLKLGTAPTRAI